MAALLPGAPARAQADGASNAPIKPAATNQKLFLPIIASGAGATTSEQTDDATHSADDYTLAEQARQRNEPPFVAPSTAAATGPLNVVGKWDPPVTWPFVFASAANLPDGRIIAWGANNTTSFSGGNSTYSAVWDPTTGQFLSTPNNNHALFCGIPTALEDGRVFVNGGDSNNAHTSTFDFRTNTWTLLQDMHVGRWYNGAVALPNGQVFTAAGEPGSPYPELWTPGRGWDYLLGASIQTAILDYPTVTEPKNWLPALHLAPNGQIFHSGHTPQMNYINPTGNGSLTPVSIRNAWDISNAPNVMFDQGKILKAGGGAKTNRAIVIDLNGATPTLTEIAPMKSARVFHNFVMLPNGEVMTVGGNTTNEKFSDNGTVLDGEIWNPTTGQWRLVASMTVPRNYHSVALLLPDGRVWAGGGGLCACSADHPDHQVFWPPYLFNTDGSLATRPVINTAPTVTTPGTTMSVQATTGMQKFSLIKLGSVTHTLNSDQRYLNLAFTAGVNGQYQLTLPSNQNVLTPGYWMLFAVNSAGVPSVAKTIQIVHNAIVLTAVDTQSTVQGAAVNLPIVARDINGATLTYSAAGLPVGLSINSTSGVITGIASTLGSYAPTVTVANNTGSSNTTTFNWTVQYVGNGSGQVLRQWWTGIAGNTIASLTGNANYPNNPTGSDMLTSFEAPLNWGDNYGTRIRGYLYPPVTGQYTFWIASDDNGQLLLSTDATPAKATVIASVPDWTNSREWTKFPQQQSVAITLQAGQKYYIEAIQKEAGGNDNLAVAWQIPGSTQDVIAGRYLSPYVPDQAYRYVKLEALSEVNGNPWTSMAEFNLLDNTGAPLSRTGWTVTADSQELQGENGSVTNAIDGNVNSIWHTQWQAASPTPPHWLIADLKTATLLTGFRYLPRQDMANGRIANYKFYLSPDGVNWSMLVAQGTFPNSTTEQKILFRTPQVPALVVDQLAAPPKQVNTAIAYTLSYRNGTNPRFKWLFGDGTAETAYATSPSSSHTFSQPGLYVVKVTATDDSNVVQTMTFMQAIYSPPTAKRPTNSTNIAYETRSGANNRVWVVNQDNDTVSAFDAVTNAKVAEIAVGSRPRSVAIAPSGRIWVTNKGAASLSLIDPATLAVVQTMNLPYASQPFGLAFAPDGSAAYVALEASGQLLKLNPTSGATLGALTVGPNVRQVSVSADSSKVYVTRFVTPKLPGEETATPTTAGVGGEVLSINAAALTLSKTIILQVSTAPDTEHSARGVPNYLGALAIAPDGTSAWTPAKQDNIQRGVLRDGNNIDFQDTVRAISARINLATEAEDYTARIDHDNAGVPSAALFDQSGAYLFVALEANRQVAVVDAYGKRELFRLDVGRAPQGLALSADGLKLYVNNFTDRTVTVLDLSKLLNGVSTTATTVATLNAVATEKLTAQVLIGKQLFYDAKDTRLARDSYMSCASCHNDGGFDGRVWDLTGMGEGLRNTIALNGRAGMGQGFLHWSGNFDEVQDFEGQIRALAGGTGLMAAADFTATQSPLGPAKAGKSADLDALAAYVGSLKTFAQSPYRNADGTLTADATTGKTLFQTLNCAQCHTGTAFTDSSNNVLRNIGTIKPSSGKRLNGALTGLDTPTLRDVWLTAPYLHDGSAATLAASVRAHQGVSITDSDLTKLVAFLQQIGSEEVQAPVNGGSGQILRQWWTGIGAGTLVTDLTSNANYPNTPTGSNQLTSFEAPSNWADNYGTRVRGYLIPPITGSYIFWIASDDNGQLLLSTDANPANARAIASVPGWTNSREWTKYPQQQSAAILLQAGQKYYIEALQKEGAGGDALAVAWQIPGSTQAVIAGTYLSPYQAPVVTNVAQGKAASESSTGFGGVAVRAVDGNTDGNFGNNSVTHTNSETNPWWQVDLGSNYQIDNLQLWNRTDCCSDRLTNFYVFVASTDMTGRTFSALVNDNTVWRYQVTGQAPAKLDLPTYVSGRYVRVQLAGTNYLSLAEVQIFGAAAGPVNISVPNVVGATQTAAQQTLTNAGLGVGTVTRAYHPTVAAGNVISQTPAAGSTVPANTLINLAVSNGPAPVVPSTAITFTTKLDFLTNGGPTDVLSRDLDGDGKADLVTANYGPVGTNGSTVSVLRNTSASGAVTFAAKADITVNNGPHELAAGDIDGDGKTDVVVGHYGAYASGNTISILRNTSTSGTIAFAPKFDLTVASGPMGVAIGDLDGDGKPEIAVAQFTDGSGNTISVLRNTSTSGAISFAPKIDVPASVGPYSVHIGDIDGDGKADLVVTNFGSFAGEGNTVSVLRNTSSTGNLSFAPKVDFTTNSGPRDFVIADVDGDGKLDVTIAHFGGNGAGNTVSVLRNTSTLGNPAFAAKVAFTVGTGAIRIVLNDLDKDGKLDVATANFGTTTTGGAGNTVSILRNTSTSGNVTFAPKVDFTVSTGPHGLASADLNGDGWPELIAANYGTISGEGNTLSILRNLNTAATSLVPNVVGATQTAAQQTLTGAGFTLGAVTQVYNSSVPAGAVISQTPAAGTSLVSGSPVALLVSLGVAPAVTVPNVVGATQTAAQQTLANANLAVGAITRVYHATVPSGSVVSQTPAAGSSASAGTAVNLTVSSGPAPTNPPLDATGFAAKLDFTTNAGPIGLASGDLDGDGKPDLAVANYGTGSGNNVSVLRNTSASGSTSFATKVDLPTNAGPYELAIGDLDGDGKLDLAVANYGGGGSGSTVSVLRNTSTSGTIAFATKVDFATNSGSLGIAIDDVDGDGKPDIAVTRFSEGAGTLVSVLRNTSTSGTIAFAPKVDFTVGVGPIGVALGDLDGDGKAELVVSNYGTFAGDGNTVSVLRNTSTSGTIAFAAKVDFATNSGPRGVVIGDVDGDGKADVLVANFGNSSGNTVSVLRNTSTPGALAFDAKVDLTVGNGALGIALRDLNKDGKADLAVSNFSSGTVSLLQNNSTSGTVAFTAKFDFASGANAFEPVITDLDGDSWPDVAVTAYGGGVNNTVAVLRNLLGTPH